MLYALLIHGREATLEVWAADQNAEMLGRHADLREELESQRRMGPRMRLQPHVATTILRAGRRPFVVDGPFAESKEQLMGLYIVDCASLDEAIAAAEQLSFEDAAVEIRPITDFDPGLLPASTASAEK